MSNHQIVVFKLNEEDFGIDINQVKEIIKPLELYKVPNVPNYIDGLINLRGKVYTVFNLRKRFNLPAAGFDDNTKIIIANSAANTVGFIVDEVNEIMRVEDDSIEPPPESIGNSAKDFIRGVIKPAGKVILLLDLNLIIASTVDHP